MKILDMEMFFLIFDYEKKEKKGHVSLYIHIPTSLTSFMKVDDLMTIFIFIET